MKSTLMLTAGLLMAAPVFADAVRVDQFKWMSGCWGFDTPNGRYEEIWTTPTGNSMLGLSRRTADGYTREYEYMRIVTSGGGGFDFIAKPKDQDETKFNALSFVGTQAVFENPDNDFPQKITYQFIAPDQLNARIEGPSKGHTMALNFPMKRQPCP